MSKFDIAYNIVRKNEGGYVFDPADPGGETYCGISRRSYSNWQGWKIVDYYKARGSVKKYTVIPDAGLEKLVKDFYFNNKYINHKLDKIESDGAAALMMDTVTNHGYGALVITEGLKSAGFKVAEVNTIKQETIDAVNSDPEKAYNAIAARRLEYVKGLKIDPKFIDGLKGRVQKFIENVYNFSWKGSAAGGTAIGIFLLLFF